MEPIVDKRPNVIMRLLKGFALLFKETASLLRYLWRTPRSEKTIVFYAEHRDYYPYFEGIIEKLTGEYRQMLCYVTSDHKDPILRNPASGIKPFYLNRLLPFFMAYVNCRVLVMTLTDLNQFHIRRSINPVHYVYVFHSLVSTHMIYRHGAFDHYDSILCCGPHQVSEIRRQEELYDLPAKKLIEAGYYRLERIYEAHHRYLSEKSPSATKGTILIAPSWGVANILESCGEELVDILLNADYEVIVRPHPETVKRFPEVIALFASKIAENPDLTLETSVATDDSLLHADILISDYSGISLEYAFGTERPVLFLDVPTKIQNQRFAELDLEPLELALRAQIGVVVSPEKLDTVPEVISNLMLSAETYKNRIGALREQHVYAFGHSSEIGAQYIVDLLN